METQRGFTLVEVLIAVGIIALVALGAVTVNASARSMAVSSAANRFDSLLDAARTMARESSYGVTIAFIPDAHGDGFVARLYHNRPGSEPLVASNAPALEARVSILEMETLGKPPFAIAIHATGAVAGIRGNVLTEVGGPELPCPASNRYRFVLSYGGGQVARDVSCRIDLASNGPASYASIAPATPQPVPTVQSCITPCVTIPPIPKVTATCPPPYLSNGPGACANPALLVSPQQLAFSGPGNPANLSFIVHEDLYTGAFHTTDNCGGAITTSNASGGGNGVTSAYSVIASSPRICSIVVSDDRGSAPVSVAIEVGRGVLVPRYVCDNHIPPAPYRTDLGPDADGIHEDFSDGTGCQVAATPLPTSTPSSIQKVAVIELQMIDDCDAGAPGSFFDLTYPSLDATMGEVATWLTAAPKRTSQPNPIDYDPTTPVSATVTERHIAPSTQQCSP